MKKLILILFAFLAISCKAQQGNFFWSYSNNVNPYFIFTVNIPSDGTSVTLPLTNLSSPTHDFIVDYGDGTIATVTDYNDADATHVYNTGIYQIKMIGVCNEFKTQGTSNIRTYITSVDNWGNMGFNRLDFNGCTNLTTLANGPITGARTVSTYLQFCLNCTSLTAIPANLFDQSVDYLLSNSAFSQAFQGCTSLTTIPADLFKYNVNISTNAFSQTFRDCTNLETVPQYLFRYNTLVDSWQACFLGCNKLQQNQYIFYAAGEETTRFLNQSPIFRSCFSRTSFTGTQGTAPELWNCSFGTGTPDTAFCWFGAGNSTTSLTNYASIPTAWK